MKEVVLSMLIPICKGCVDDVDEELRRGYMPKRVMVVDDDKGTGNRYLCA